MTHQQLCQSIQQIREGIQREQSCLDSRLETIQTEIDAAFGPMRGMLLHEKRQIEARLEALNDSTRRMKMETHFSSVNTQVQSGRSQRERESIVAELHTHGDSVSTNMEICDCHSELVVGEFGETMCPECGAMQSTVDEKVESMVEPSFYHYKNERYAAVVLNRITGEPSHPGIPEYVVQAVVRELVEKQGVRNASDITVGDIGDALNNISADVDGKTIRLRKYFKDRTEVWAKVVNQPPPLLVPRMSREIIKLFANVVNQGNLEAHHQTTASEKEREEQRTNFQGYQYYLRAAIQTYMHMPDVSDADKHSLARLGELDVFMERTGKTSTKTHLQNARYEKAWIAAVKHLYPALNFTSAHLKWPPPASRKRKHA